MGIFKIKRNRLSLVIVLIGALLALALLFCAEGAVSSSASEGSRGDSLKVGVKSYIVNFSYYNERTDAYYGLEVDLARALAEKLGYSEVEFVEVTQDNCEDMINDGSIDCLIACYSYSEYRSDYFDFSPVYYTDAGKVMVAKSSLYTGISDLVGKNIGVNHGSSSWHLFGQLMAELGYIESGDDDTISENFNIVKYDEIEELFHDLEVGAVDAVCADEAILKTYYDSDKYTILDERYSDEEYAVATKKGSDLSADIYDAVSGLLEDGTIESLVEKWN